MSMEASKEDVILVHLTDLHIRNSDSPSLSKLAAVAPAVGGLIEGPSHVVFVISGDVAFSGEKVQYDLALRAFREMRDELAKWKPISVTFVVAPGNHDCDFKAVADSVRMALISAGGLDGDDAEDVLNVLEPVQHNFFEFCRDLSEGKQVKHNQIASEVSISFGGISFRFLPVNTAIASMRREHPGELRLPWQLLPNEKSEADLTIVVAHHPLNWLRPGDAVNFSEWLDNNADQVVLGHEHRLDQFEQARERVGSTVSYQIGTPVDDSEVRTGFKCTRIDTEERQATDFDVYFTREGKAQAVEVATRGVKQNAARDRGLLRFSQSHAAFLDDPGAGFSHTHLNRALTLADIFVAPDFREFKSERVSNNQGKGSISTDEICEEIFKSRGRFVVFGAEQSGKTTFAKYLIRKARLRKVFPLYLDCLQLSSVNKGEIRGWINHAIDKQYEGASATELRSTPPSQALIILDNVHALLGGTEASDLVLTFLAARSEAIVILSADNPAVSIVAAGALQEDVAYVKGSRLFDLLPLGHRRRGQLIRKWIALGRNVVDHAEKIEAEVRQTKALLDKVLGRNSLPKYPIFVLVLLQQLEGLKKTDTVIANASHGHIFEALITHALERYVRCHKIGTVNDFLSELAFQVNRRSGSISIGLVENIVASFRDRLIRIDLRPLLLELQDARILTVESGLVGFRYSYLGYYYLAKWICDNQSDPLSEILLDECVSLVHTERSANVLLFIAHMKHEQLVLDRLLPMADELFSDSPEGRLEDYSGLSVRFRTAAQRAVLLQGAAVDVSDTTYSRQDSLDGDIGSPEPDPVVEDGLKLNTSLKLMSALGQILKSRGSSMAPEQMIMLGSSIIRLSRRLMSFLYKLIEDHAGDIVHAASDAFEDSFKVDRALAVKIANQMIGAIVAGVAQTCVGRAADAMASFELEPLLQRLDKELNDQDSRLVTLVARVMGERLYPKDIVEDYIGSLRPANVLPRTVLAGAAASRFYLDPPPRQVRDSACALLGIDVKHLPNKVAN